MHVLSYFKKLFQIDSQFEIEFQYRYENMNDMLTNKWMICYIDR